MSASNEKKTRKDAISETPKTAMEIEKQKAEKRSNFLYGLIAVVFVVLAVVSLVWKSGIVNRTATAVTIDGQKYSAAEVNFYYQNVYRSFLSSNSYFISYLGLDTSSSLKNQTINATAASMMGVEEGSSWFDYMMDNAIHQMTTIQKGLEAAKAEGYQFPDSVQAQYQDSMDSLKTAATSSGMSVNKYLQQNLGSTMTEKVYGQQVLKLLQYQDYANAYADRLTYTDEQLEEAYQADTKTYDKASWEYVVVSGAAESTTDADGNTVQPTDEETEAAKAAAKILAAYKAGTSLESAAGNYEKASYYSSDSTAYYDGTTGNWLFDGARKSGDTAVLEVGSSYYVALFHSCGREEYNTVDVRHILIQPESGTLSTDDEGYDAEQEELKAAARTKAEEILAEWKAGDATEDSFAKLAMEDSADGSKYTGGLYTRITKGQMVEAFNDWCFDSSRKSGDTDVVDTTYGSHVMYFVGTDLPAWAAAVTDNLQTEDTNKWNEELTKDAVTEQKDFGMKFVG